MKKLAVLAGILAAFFITACGYETVSSQPTVSTALRGTWKSNDPSIYDGTLTISISSTTQRITIAGYDESQAPWTLNGRDDSKLPFKGFPKNAPLKFRWESEEGKIDGTLEGILFITVPGKDEESLPFVYFEGYTWDTGSYKKITDKFLRFTFGGRDEILENSNNFKPQTPPASP